MIDPGSASANTDLNTLNSNITDSNISDSADGGEPLNDQALDTPVNEPAESALRPVSVEDEESVQIDEASLDLALTVAEAADDRKAGNITILQAGDVSYLADYFVIVTGFSNVQVRAIANSIEGAVEDKFERKALRTEGMSEGRWVLKDYGEVIVHIFMPDDREFYDLEAFWGHANRIEFVPTSPLSA